MRPPSWRHYHRRQGEYRKRDSGWHFSKKNSECRIPVGKMASFGLPRALFLASLCAVLASARGPLRVGPRGLFSSFAVAAVGFPLAPVGAWKLAAEHACYANGTYYLTNCCDRSEVFYCFGDACVVAHGCTICTDDDCWELAASGISVKPGTTALVAPARRHVVSLLFVCYTCELLGAGEACAATFLIWSVSQTWIGFTPPLTCERDCAMAWSATLEGLWKGPVNDVFEVLSMILYGIPKAVWAALEDGAGLAAVIGLLYLMEERFIHALLVFVLVVTAYSVEARQTSLVYASLPVAAAVPKGLDEFIHNTMQGWARRSRGMSDFEPCCMVNQTLKRCNEGQPGPMNWTAYSMNVSGEWICQSGVFVRSAHTTLVYGNGKLYGPKCGRNLTVSDKGAQIQCHWGGHHKWHGTGNFSGRPPVGGSATCRIWTHDWKTLVHTCVIDRRAPWCGNCTRDCWPETGSALMGFENCGVGERFTEHLSANLTKKFVPNQGHTLEAEAGEVLALIGGEGHKIICPAGRDSVLPEYMPGTPVGQVFRNKALDWIGTGWFAIPGLFTLRQEYYNVCLGFAFRWEDAVDGMIHVNRRHASGHQAVRGGVPPKGYFMFDVFLFTLVTMKLMGARWVPFLVVGLWAQLTPFALGAVSPMLASGPMAAAAVVEASWLNCFLLLLNLFLYVRCEAFGRLVSVIGFKLYRGWVMAAVLGALSYARRKHSVAGDCTVCFTMGAGPGLDLWWGLAIVISYAALTLATFTRAGKGLKLRAYAKWARFYGRLHDWVYTSPVGDVEVSWKVTGAWWAVCIAWPHETLCALVWMYVVFGFIDAIDVYFEAVLCVTPNLRPITRLVESIAVRGEVGCLKVVLNCLERKGIHLYKHMGQLGERTVALLEEIGATLEPAAIRPAELESIRDEQFVLACGSEYGGKPVVARRGAEVLIGHSCSALDLPPGFHYCAPLLLRREGKNAFSVMLHSMRGRDDANHNGQIMVLGTALSRSCGTVVGGVMYTTFHSSGGKSLATATGPVYPRWISASADLAAYPAPKGSSSLEACGCHTSSGWAMTREGMLVHGVVREDHIHFDTDRRLRDFKGASGSPVMCDSGHVVGILLSVNHAGPRVYSAKFAKPWSVRPSDVTAPSASAGLPRVGAVYRAEQLYAPTGSGKSTRIPAEYVGMGHKVLVLNPSVATTASMQVYMKYQYKINCDVLAGHGATEHSVRSGSPLTYATYGRLLGGDCTLLQGKDVVICDECHSVDPTTLLGIGAVLHKAKDAGVKLVLLATATPPGTQLTKHPNIDEVQLGREGDIPFYGCTIDTRHFDSGRHLIFCHSKAECERVATACSVYKKTVTYYRGKPVSVIPSTGDIIVVATDALSTGYTGNFDTVTDCNTHIEEQVDVDLAPTITISVRTAHCDAGLRMQRRGRCGRGKKGTYFYVTPSAQPVGVLPSGNLWQAVEMGFCWFGLSARVIRDYLAAYNDSPATPLANVSVDDPINFFEVLKPFLYTPEVRGMMSDGYTWPLLCGAQQRLCRNADAEPPSEDPRWKCSGKNACPLLARWAGSEPRRIVESDTAYKLKQALGCPVDVPTVGPALLVGAAVACAAAVVNATGCLVVVAAWKVGQAEKGKLTLNDTLLLETLSTVETAVGWDVAADGFARMVEWARGGAVGAASRVIEWWGPIPANQETWLLLLARVVTQWASVITGGVALSVAGLNPVLGAFSSFASGMLSSLAPEVHVVVGALAGAIGSIVGGPGAGTAIGAAFLAGGVAGTSATVGGLMGGLVGWESAVTGATIAFDCLSGTATKDLIPRAMVCVANPGAACAGAIIGVILHRAAGSESTQDWTNRVLATLPRGSVLPDRFFLDGDPRDKIHKVLRDVSLVELVRRLINSITTEGSVDCGGTVWEVLGDLVYWVRELLTWLWSNAKSIFPSVGIPIVSCQKPYRGAWRGSGVVTTKCPCGNATTLQINEGVVTWRQDTKWFCSSAIARGVPINTQGAARGPSPLDIPLEGGIVARYPYGLTGWVEIKYATAGPELYATTEAQISRTGLMQSMRHPPVLVGGVSRSWRNYHTPATMTFTAGAVIIYAGGAVKLPHRLSLGAQIDRDPSTSSVMTEDGEVDACPLVEVESTPSVVGGEEVEHPTVTKEPDDGLVEVPLEWNGDDLFGTKVYAKPGMTMRQFKRGVEGLVGGSIPIKFTQKGEELEMEEILPSTSFTATVADDVDWGVTDLSAPLAEPLAAKTFTLNRGMSQHRSEKLLHITITCCDMALTLVEPWRPDLNLLQTVERSFLRYEHLILEGVYETDMIWSKEDILCHVPVLNGCVTSWTCGIESAAASGGVDARLTFKCNSDKPRGREPTVSGRINRTRVRLNCTRCDKKEVNAGFFIGDQYNMAFDNNRGLAHEDHILKIGKNTYEWSDTITEETAFKPWKVICEHEACEVPEELKDAIPLEAIKHTLGVRIMCCGDVADFSFPLLETKTWLDQVHSHGCMLMVEPWNRPTWEAHTPLVEGHEVNWNAYPSLAGAASTLKLELRCPKALPQQPQESEVTELEVRVARTCCGHHDLQTYKLPAGSTVGDLLTLADMVPERHSVRIKGKVYETTDALPSDKLVLAGILCRMTAEPCGTTLTPDIPDMCLCRLDVRCCGGKPLEAYHLPSDSVAMLLTTLGINPDVHTVRVDGKTLKGDDPLPVLAKWSGAVRCTLKSEKCGYSYIWNGLPLGLREMRQRPPITPIGGFLRANPGRAYRTDPAQVGERIEMVTKQQTVAKYDAYLRDAFNAALATAKKTRSHGYDYDTAVSKVRPRSAPGHNVKLTVKDLHTDYGRQVVEKTLEDIRLGRGEHPFCVSAKQEVFPMTKKTKKPPRIICYPSLEFRVAEKMILGDPGIVTRAILGPAYGFVTPQQRVSRLIQMWKSKKHPMAITVDAKCFDSSITSEDVARETELYAAASDRPDLVRALGARYARGLMVNPHGVIVGERFCRASGVLTTSASNTITAYLKVSAACRAVGIPKPDYLISGDDTCIVCEECELTDQLRMKLAEYGFECEPTAHHSLDTAETCQSFVASVYTDRHEYILSTKMERALARACSEWSDPIASACGYVLLYPHHPITRYLLLMQVLALTFKAGKKPDDPVVCEVRGNTLTFPLLSLPRILVGLHGPGCLRVRSDSVKTITEAHRALQIMGCKGMGWYKRRWLRLRVALLRAGGGWAYLAKTLMWLPQDGPPPRVSPLDLGDCTPFDDPYQGYAFEYKLPEKKKQKWVAFLAVTLLAVFTAVMVG